MPERKAIRPPSQRAEQMLRELQERVAKAGPSDSLIAHVQHREQRDSRQQLPGKPGAPEAAVSLAKGVRGVKAQAARPAPELEYAIGADGRDEREESEWFQALPEQEQQRLHAAWAHKRQLKSTANVAQKRIGNRRMVAAWISSVLVVLIGSHLFWHATLGAGVVCGFWWRHSSPDRFLDPLRGFLCLLVVQGIVMVAQHASNPGMMIDSVLLVAFAALVGFDGEIRRSGGFDVMAS